MNLAVLFFAEAALAVAAGFFLGRLRNGRRRDAAFRKAEDAFRKQYGLPGKLPGEVKIFPGAKAAVSGFNFRGSEAVLHVDEWVVTAPDPAPLYALVLELRKRGADISLCMEEQLKFNLDLSKHPGEEGYMPDYQLTAKDLAQIRAANQRRKNTRCG